jgi:LssY C-terminus
MIRWLKRMVQRAVVVALGVFSVWLIVFVVFDTADNRLPWIVSVALTYAIAAYVILPRAVRMGLKVLQRKRVPSYTTTTDGFPGDPVNLVLIGTRTQLHAAFAKCGWTIADKLSFTSCVRMAQSFVFNRPYPTAPFSTLYLFGRGQDRGFQKPIGDSPRKRHHVRFWALGLDHAGVALSSADFWLNTDCPPLDVPVLWIGAATKDTGFSLTRLTFQVTHATDSDTNIERDYVLDELKNNAAIAGVTVYQACQPLRVTHVNHYLTDGEVAVANLAENLAENLATSPAA